VDLRSGEGSQALRWIIRQQYLLFGGEKLVNNLPGAQEPGARLKAAETFFGMLKLSKTYAWVFRESEDPDFCSSRRAHKRAKVRRGPTEPSVKPTLFQTLFGACKRVSGLRRSSTVPRTRTDNLPRTHRTRGQIPGWPSALRSVESTPRFTWKSTESDDAGRRLPSSRGGYWPLKAATDFGYARKLAEGFFGTLRLAEG